LKVRATSNTAASGHGPADTRSRSRQTVTLEIVEELMSWSPIEMMGAYRRLHRGGLSLVHLHVLALLSVDGSLSMGRLAEALDVSVASATGIVGRMEAKGLVRRRHAERDRRVVLVESTTAAQEVFREIDERRREGLTRVLRHLADSDLDALLTGHRALRAARSASVAERPAE
jgi:DNA-binding MarR family transcriptional regulator